MPARRLWHPRSVSRARAVRLHLCPTYRSRLRISMTPFGGSRRWGSSSSMVRQLRNVRRFYVRDPFGRRCHLAVYHGRLASPTPDYERSGNAMLNRLFGATLHDVPWTGDRNTAIQALGERLRAEGLRPYVVPYGVSSALGAVAYATTALEIAEQS